MIWGCGADLTKSRVHYLGYSLFYRQCLYSRYCEVVLWVDSNYPNYVRDGFPVSSPGEIYDLLNEDFDYVIIAIYSRTHCECIKHDLMMHGIAEDKIFNGFRNMPTLRQQLYKNRFKVTEISEAHENFLQSDKRLLSDLNESKQSSGFSEQVEVRCFILYGHLWNVVYPVYRAFLKDDRFNVKLIGKDLKKENVIDWDDYFSEVDYYDICIYATQDGVWNRDLEMLDCIYDNRISNRNKKTLNICIQGILINLWRPQENLLQQLSPIWNRYHADFVLFDKYVYDELEEYGLLTQKEFQLMGNPKFDVIYEKLKGEKIYPQGWEKLKDKKVFLITTDHHWTWPDVTLDLYFQTYLRYFQDHPEYAMILRPHPFFFTELIRDKVLSDVDLDRIRRFFRNSENMVLDELHDYGISYKISDFVIVDSNCGIMLSALPMEKPMCVPVRYDGKEPTIVKEPFLEAFYKYKSPEECIELFDKLVAGVDPKKQKRQVLMKQVILHYDGKNGERVKQFIEGQYFATSN